MSENKEEKVLNANIVMLDLDGETIEMSNKSSEPVIIENGDVLKSEIHIAFFPVYKG